MWCDWHRSDDLRVAALLEAVRGAVPAGAYRHARGLVAEVLASGFDPATDPFNTAYLPGQVLDLEVADVVMAELPQDRDAIGLRLGELHQQAGDRRAAIEVVESLTPSTTAAVSLAELYAEGENWPAVVELTDGLSSPACTTPCAQSASTASSQSPGAPPRPHPQPAPRPGRSRPVRSRPGDGLR